MKVSELLGLKVISKSKNKSEYSVNQSILSIVFVGLPIASFILSFFVHFFSYVFLISFFLLIVVIIIYFIVYWEFVISQFKGYSIRYDLLSWWPLKYRAVIEKTKSKGFMKPSQIINIKNFKNK